MADDNGIDEGFGAELPPSGGASIPPPQPPKEPGGTLSTLEVGKQIAQYTLEAYKAGFVVIKDNLPALMNAEIFARAVAAQVELFEALTSPLRTVLTDVETLGAQTVNVAEGIQRLTGLNALALERGDFGMDNLGRKMAQRAMDATNAFATMKIALMDGTEATAAQFGKGEEFFESYAASALDDTKLFVAATEGMNESIIKGVHLAKRNLGLSTVELNQILNIELAKTGKISGDFLKEFEKTTIATAEATGIPAQLVTKNLNSMLADFTHFGNMTLPQMGSLTNTISRLGVEMSDVTKIADKFSSFDSAAQAMSNLAATTGVTLDTLDLFEKAASGDIESFIESFREQLDAQGLEFENLNFMQQKQIAAGFGIDPRVMQKLMNDNFATIESATAEIEAKSSALSDEQTERLIASMARLDELTPTQLVERAEGMRTASLEYAASIERGYLAISKSASAGLDMIQQGQSVFMDKVRERRKALDELTGVIEDADKKIAARRAKIVEEPARIAAPTGTQAVEVPAPAPAASPTVSASTSVAPSSVPAPVETASTGIPIATPTPPSLTPAAAPETAPSPAGAPATTGTPANQTQFQSGGTEEVASLTTAVRELVAGLSQPTVIEFRAGDRLAAELLNHLETGVEQPGGGSAAVRVVKYT